MSRYGWGGDVWLDDNGAPLSGGKLYFYETGTTTAKDTYSDSAQTVPNTNPVILDAAGRQGDVFFSGLAKLVLQTSAGVQIDVSDPIGESSVANAFGDWLVTVEYGVGDTVTGPDGNYYVSITSANTGNNPSISPTQWQELQYVYAYNANFSYDAGDICLSNNVAYVSIVGTNLANTPVSSPSDWKPLNTEAWLDIVVKTANFNAVAGRFYLINTNGGAFTMTLPVSASDGDKIGFVDYGGQFGTFNFTVGRNGLEIMDSATDLVCDISYFSTTLVYTTGRGWIIT